MTRSEMVVSLVKADRPVMVRRTKVVRRWWTLVGVHHLLAKEGADGNIDRHRDLVRRPAQSTLHRSRREWPARRCRERPALGARGICTGGGLQTERRARLSYIPTTPGPFRQTWVLGKGGAEMSLSLTPEIRTVIDSTASTSI